MASDAPPDHQKKKRKDLHAQLAELRRRRIESPSDTDTAKKDIRRGMLKQIRSQQERPPTSTRKQDNRVKPIIYQRGLPRQQTATHRRGKRFGPKIVLEEAVTGSEATCPQGRPFFLVANRAKNIAGAEGLADTFRKALLRTDSYLMQRLAIAGATTEMTVEDVIFLDLETAGLGSSPLFLVGAMVWDGDDFEVRQFLARNYAEERAVIARFVEMCGEKKLLITFNGKSFDFPFVRTRAAATGVPFSLSPAHFDLLHECRRIWKGHFADCKLQTIERHVCGRERHGDIPGRDIPDAYHAYVRTQDACEIVEVLKHNMLDLVTLADIMTRFPEP